MYPDMPPEPILQGVSMLYCPTCKYETKVTWSGKLSIKRCWKCDSMLEERN